MTNLKTQQRVSTNPHKLTLREH